MYKALFGNLTAILIYSNFAQAGPMYELDPLNTTYNGESSASAISPDGKIIVGFMRNLSYETRAFRWTSESIVSLDALDANGKEYSSASMISADGNVIAGWSAIPRGRDTIARAVRWTKAGGLQDLGSLSTRNDTDSIAYAINSDGSVIVGESSINSYQVQAFRWTEISGKMHNLGTLKYDNTGSSVARDVSADGTIVVGSAATDFNTSHAFRWDDTSGKMEDLGTLIPDNSGYSNALKISSDGSTIVGYSHINSSQDYHAFRWTESLGRMQDLGTLGEDSRATGVNADGTVIIGTSYGPQGEHAFRWTESSNLMQDLGTLKANNTGTSSVSAMSADGRVVVGASEIDSGEMHAYFWSDNLGKMQDLGTLRTDNTGDSKANGISADGRIIIGEASSDKGVNRAFIYRIYDSGIQDYENIFRSFPKLSAEKEMAAAQQQLAVSRLLDTNCFVGATGANCLRLTGVVSNAQSDGDIGRRSQSQGLLTLGHGFTDNLTLGANVSAGSIRLHNSGIDPKTAYGLSVWGKYNESGLAGTGFQANAGIGYNTQDNDLNRGKDLNKVQQIKGTTDLKTVSGRFALGYGFSHESGWLLTPGVALVRQQTAFDGYKEKDGAFTASYKRAHLKSTVVDLGLSAKKAITSLSGLELGAGLEQDISVERMRLKGSSELPGAISFDNKSSLDRNSARPYATVGYTYDLNAAGTLSAGVRAARDIFSDQPEVSILASYGIKF